MPYRQLLSMIDMGWAPDRADCHACHHDIVKDKDLRIFAATAQGLDGANLKIRNENFFDLLDYGREQLPYWITSFTQLWSHSTNSNPWEITVMGTARNEMGERFGVYKRACDTTSFVFVRECICCGEPDPLGVSAYLAKSGARNIEAPHDFVDAIRKHQKFEKERQTRQKNDRDIQRQAHLDLNEEALKTCSACHATIRKKGQYCTQCGQKC